MIPAGDRPRKNSAAGRGGRDDAPSALTPGESHGDFLGPEPPQVAWPSSLEPAKDASLGDAHLASNALSGYNGSMANTLTVRNLQDSLKQKLRVRAALHGRSMEAEVREILAQTLADDSVPAPLAGRFAHLVGVWKGRLTTEQVLNLTRGE